MKKIADEIDVLFGFGSTWTFNCGGGCSEYRGTINIDDDEIAGIFQGAGVGVAEKNLIVRFIMGHEKGHHLQDKTWPDRDYRVEHHVMEIEADLVGAWALARQNQANNQTINANIVRNFDDAYRIAQRLGISIGDTDGNKPHHPWAEQRELALVRGPEIAALYRGNLTEGDRKRFAEDIGGVALRVKSNGL
jgi:hypothetical protein